jgi:hypothetical protein
VRRYTFQAGGFAGGWTNLFLDTPNELQNAIDSNLRKRNVGRVISVKVEADEWDATARVLYNQFRYRATIVIESSAAESVITADVRDAVNSLTGQAVTVTNLAVDGEQELPNSNPIPQIGDAAKKALDAANKTLMLVVALGVVAIVILNKTR